MPYPNHQTLLRLHGLLLSSTTYAYVHSRSQSTHWSQSRNSDLHSGDEHVITSNILFKFHCVDPFNTQNRPFNYPCISHFVSCFLSVWNTRRSSSKKSNEIPLWASYGSFIKIELNEIISDLICYEGQRSTKLGAIPKLLCWLSKVTKHSVMIVTVIFLLLCLVRLQQQVTLIFKVPDVWNFTHLWPNSRYITSLCLIL